MKVSEARSSEAHSFCASQAKFVAEGRREREKKRKRKREKVVDFLINLREKEREKVYSYQYLLASITVNVISLEVKHRAARVLSHCRTMETIRCYDPIRSLQESSRIDPCEDRWSLCGFGLCFIRT